MEWTNKMVRWLWGQKEKIELRLSADRGKTIDFRDFNLQWTYSLEFADHFGFYFSFLAQAVPEISTFKGWAFIGHFTPSLLGRVAWNLVFWVNSDQELRSDWGGRWLMDLPDPVVRWYMNTLIWDQCYNKHWCKSEGIGM